MEQFQILVKTDNILPCKDLWGFFYGKRPIFWCRKSHKFIRWQNTLIAYSFKRKADTGGYNEFEPGATFDNTGFEDRERPPLRPIDAYCLPEIPWLSKRYTIALLTCMGFIIAFGMRCNMAMAKIQMRNSTGKGKFNWTVGVESALDSSFFWGYLLTQVPGGFLASLYPANRIFGGAIAISSFLNLLVPGALTLSPVMDMMVQACRGFVEVGTSTRWSKPPISPILVKRLKISTYKMKD